MSIIDKIFHISDIHIRNLKRHKEYELVFDKLYKEIEQRKTENSLIVVAGDIVHSKLELSPEVVDVTSRFFRNLSNLCDTIVITGNHDANLNNKYRLDALTPIIENLNIPNLYYYKDSGVYEHGDVSFAVWSIFDDEQTYIKAKDINTTNTKIGLYHGPVNSARTDVGFFIHNNKVTVDMMDGYDMFLLGDIHSFQYLNDAETICYGGSLLQQNHGESLTGHGMVVWDVPTRKSEFVEIPNDFGFYTLEINNGKVPNVKDMPKNPRLRIKVANTDMADIKKVLTKIRKKYNVDEFTVIRTDTLSKQKRDTNGQDIKYTGIQDIEHQNNLIKDYVEKYYIDIDDDTISEMLKINRDLNTRIKEEDVIRNIQWFPKKFEFSNMFSYGENNVIDFSTLDGINGLFAANASGKSSIFDALSFCIFDKCSRTYKADQILNNKKDKFSCKFNFEIDGTNYFIEKFGNRQKAGNVKVNLDFYKIDESGNKEILNGEQRRDTTSNIRHYLGTYEDFIFTCLSLQGNNSIFTEMSQSERKDLLAQLMGLNIFDKLYVEASDEIKEMNALIRKFKRDDFTKELSELETEGDALKDELKSITNELSDSKNKLDELDDTIHQAYTRLIPVDGVDTDIDTLQSEIEKVSLSIAGNATDIEEYKKIIEKDVAARLELQKELENAAELKLRYDTHIQNKDEYKKLCKKYDRKELEIKHLESSILKIKESLDMEINDECDACLANTERFNKDYTQSLEKLGKLRAEFDTISDEKADLEKLVDDSVEDEWAGMKTTHNRYKKLGDDIIYNELQITTIEDRTTAGLQRIEVLQQKIDKYYANEDAIKSNKLVNQEINNLKSERNKLKELIERVDKKREDKNKRVGSIETRVQSISDTIEETKQLEQKLRVYEYYLDAVKRDGVPYDLIKRVIPVIEDEVNNILQQIVDFSINIHIDGKNINAKIVYDDKEWPLELASGMERFISGLAIRVSLMNISNLPRPNFIAIDEGMGVLDSDNLNSMFMLFQYLKSQFKFVIVISHLDSVRDMVNDFIEIKKEKGFSKLEHF